MFILKSMDFLNGNLFQQLIVSFNEFYTHITIKQENQIIRLKYIVLIQSTIFLQLYP